jgi:hypothetical protein
MYLSKNFFNMFLLPALAFSWSLNLEEIKETISSRFT